MTAADSPDKILIVLVIADAIHQKVAKIGERATT
jgi:hypothetical protein